MTVEILIKQAYHTQAGWNIDVVAGNFRHRITISHEYWRRLTREKISPIELARIALGYAQERGQIDYLPEVFNLEFLETKMPDFESHIKTLVRVEAAASP